MVMNTINIIPCWFNKVEEIVLPNSLSYLAPDLTREVIINNISISKIISLLKDKDKELFENSNLFKKGFCNKKTEFLIEHWRKELKILPPSISFCRMTNKLIVCDGRHRINLSQYLGVNHIPILVLLYEWKIISFMLMGKCGNF